VLVLERRAKVGGGATTDELHPGFRVPTLSHLLDPLRPGLLRDLDLQAVARQLEVPEQLRPQQAADVRAVRVHPAFLDLAADGRAADLGVALDHEHLEP